MKSDKGVRDAANPKIFRPGYMGIFQMNKSRLITVVVTLAAVAVLSRTAQGQKLLLNRTA